MVERESNVCVEGTSVRSGHGLACLFLSSHLSVFRREFEKFSRVTNSVSFPMSPFASVVCPDLGCAIPFFF